MSSIRFLLAGAVLLSAPSLLTNAPARPTAKQKTASTAAKVNPEDNPVPSFGPAPAWVVDEPVPAAADPKHKDQPFHFLFSTSQEHLAADSLENYLSYVVQPTNQAGLQAIGTVVIPWNVAQTSLTLHRVSIDRGGKTIDALRQGDVSVIQRETKLEQSTLNGVRSVVLPVRGLQVGDKLRVDFSYKTRPNRVGLTEEVQDFTVGVPVARLVRRFVISEGLPVRWAVDPSVKERPAAKQGLTERVFVADNVEPAKELSYVPERLKQKLIQVSTYRSWQDVADTLTPLFDEARKIEPGSEAEALAQRIAAASSDDRSRLLAALRATQDEVRYVAVLLGEGAYKPTTAEEVWTGRFGDCKGKTALLLGLLDRLGIQADPVLASVENDDGLDKRLPTLVMFDHVFVRARIGSDTYYLDPTRFGQRTFDELRTATTRHILPLTSNSTLVTVPDVLPTAPLQDALVVWDARSGVTEETPFEATLTLRGATAADMRAETTGSTDREKLLLALKNRIPGISNELLEHVSTQPEGPDGTYVVRFKGKASLDWSPVEGLKGNRLQLTQSTVAWEAEFDRNDDSAKDVPVVMDFPYWERLTEKVLLPNGGKDFILDAQPIDATVAATHIHRSLSMGDGVVTAVSNFKRLQRELSGAEARSAKEPLQKINNEFAYVVSRKKLKLPR